MKINPGFERGSGLLLHITSLPGKFGIGNLGKCSYDFIDYLRAGGQKYWQILPLGPVSSGHSYSPYSSYSSFAGNPLFIDPESLQNESWVKEDITSGLSKRENNEYVDFDLVTGEINQVLKRAHKEFLNNAKTFDREKYNGFCIKDNYWLEDFSLFESLAKHFGSYDWRSWEEGISKRKLDSVITYRNLMTDEVNFVKFVQFIFDKQWRSLKKYCYKNRLKLIGDIPIYAGMDSADVWANTKIFQFSADLTPSGVAGVPPDYFSEKGQKWGNPLYRWFTGDTLNEDILGWWHLRVKRIMEMVDIIRIDHFRGFDSYWKIPHDSRNGIIGEWKKGPGANLFYHLQNKIGVLPVIAEDLGIITESTRALRENLGFPGMKILQFAFDHDSENPYLPENINDPDNVIYTGTHDNNTSTGWFFEEITEKRTKDYITKYLKLEDDRDFLWKFIEISISSNADISILPLQDLLGLSGRARLNTPGTSNNTNWRWKSTGSAFEKEKMEKLHYLCKKFKR